MKEMYDFIKYENIGGNGWPCMEMRFESNKIIYDNF